MTPSPSTDDPEPLEREIGALHRVLDQIMEGIEDIETRARLVPRVATAGIQAARARHAIGGSERASLARIMAILAGLDAEVSTDASKGASGVEGDRVG